MNITYTITDNNLTINHILNEKLHVSTRLKNKLINNHQILLNNVPIDTRLIPQINDVLTLVLDYPEDNSNIIPCKMDLQILYEDSHLLIVNKPSGIAIHPSILHFDNTLSNGVRYYYDSIGLAKKIRPVNRLDLNTSGIVIFAKNEYAQESLIRQMQQNIFSKEYIALVHGSFSENHGIIDKPIDRKPNSIIERCISPTGKTAITEYEVLKSNACLDDFLTYRNNSDYSHPTDDNNYSLIKCKLLTGRTHQIRVHFSSINHPLVGDSLYGSASDFIEGQALHCYKLSFFHPVTNKFITLCT